MEHKFDRPGPVPRAVAKGATAILLVCAGAGFAMFAYGVRSVSVDVRWGLFLCTVAGGFLALLAGVARTGPEWRANFAITIVLIAIASFAANAVLVLQPQPYEELAVIARQQGKPFDTRSPFEVLADLRRDGITAWPRFPISALLDDPEISLAFARLLPVGGISRVMTVQCNESGAYAIYTSDRYGFKNEDAAYQAPGGIELMVVGDSFSQGACVPLGEDPAGQLRRLGHNSVTVGNYGNGPLIELASLLEYGPTLKPHDVLWMFYDNDIEDLDRERHNQMLMGYLGGGLQNLIARQKEVDELLKGIADLKARELPPSAKDKLKAMLTLYEVRKLLDLDRDQWTTRIDMEGDLALFERILQKARGAVEGWGGHLDFVYLPDWESVARGDPPLRGEILSIAEKSSTPVIDFEPTLRQTGDPLAYFPMRRPNHYTSDGYGLLARQILASVFPARQTVPVARSTVQ